MNSVQAEPPELIRLLRDVCVARQIPFELLCGAVEESLATAYRTHTGSSSAIARLDMRTGGIEVYERRAVVAVVADPLIEIALGSVPGFELGDFVDRRVEPGSFARIAALTAKRVILQRVLEFERERVFQHYRERQGTIVEGLVQRDVGGALYVLLDERNEAALPPWERLPRERYNINDRIRAELHSVKKTRRGPVLILSRASDRFIRLLIDDDAVVAAAREPGFLTMLLTTRQVDVTPARREMRDDRERIEQIPFSADPLEVIERCLPRGTQLIERTDIGVVLAISDHPATFERASIAGRLAGKRAIAAHPDDVDAVIADLTPAAEAEARDEVTIDPELIAKLQQFAREREGNITE